MVDICRSLAGMFQVVKMDSKIIHCLELTSIFTDVPCYPPPGQANTLDGSKESRYSPWKSTLSCGDYGLQRSLAERSNHFYTSEGLQSIRMLPLQHVNVTGCSLTPLYNLNVHPSLEGDSTPLIMLTPPPLCQVGNVSGGISLSCQ